MELFRSKIMNECGKAKLTLKYLSQLLKLAFLPQLFVLLLVTPLHISCRSYPESGQISV